MPVRDFTSAYRDSTKGSTLKALALRRAELQTALASQKPREVKSAWQGGANVADTISGAIREGRLANQEAAGRERFAQLLAGGLSPDEIGEAMGLDPDTTMKYQERTWAKEDYDTKERTRLGERQEDRDWMVKDANDRIAADRETSRLSREDAARIDKEQLEAAAAAGKIDIVTGEEATKLDPSLDPARRYAVSKDGTQIEDITPDVDTTYTYRPATDEERAQYNIPAGQGLKMKIGSDGSVNPEGVGGGAPQATPPSSEVASRIGLMTDFLEKFPDVDAEVSAGSLTGPKYLYSVTGGYGKGGEAARIIETGSEALIRNLTGMGMPASEETKYRKLYQPGPFDTVEKLRSKIKKLRTDMLNVREGALSGRKWNEVIDPAVLEDEPQTTVQPDATAAPPPDATAAPPPDATAAPAPAPGAAQAAPDPAAEAAELAEAQRVIDAGGDEAAIRAEFAASGFDPAKLRPKRGP